MQDVRILLEDWRACTDHFFRVVVAFQQQSKAGAEKPYLFRTYKNLHKSKNPEERKLGTFLRSSSSPILDSTMSPRTCLCNV